ncbi:MAG: homoserine kinase [Exilispira sp.]|jgi:homoserine kinase|nr:homoserine kinase [Exilispira sp.]
MKIVVPATTSNLASGFDVLGMALEIFLKVEIKYDSDCFNIMGCPKEYCNEDNLIVKGMKKIFEKVDKEYWDKIKNRISINIESEIPIARGLGSSASCIAAGLVFANEYLFKNHGKSKFDNTQLVKFGTEIEGHPDNISAAILGGITSSAIDNENNTIYSQKINISSEFLERYNFYVLIPDFEVKTEKARELLPKTVEFTDAVFNLSRLALLFTSLINNDENLFKFSFEDRLHQRYRSKLIFNYDEIIDYSKESGAISTFISGSGSSIVAITKATENNLNCSGKNIGQSKKNLSFDKKNEETYESDRESKKDYFEENMKEKLRYIIKKYNRLWEIKKVKINHDGAKIVEG